MIRCGSDILKGSSWGFYSFLENVSYFVATILRIWERQQILRTDC
jgi:hypothetical protein